MKKSNKNKRSGKKEEEDKSSVSKKLRTTIEEKDDKEKEEKVEETKKLEPFADPTYDVTFKMLFEDENNSELLISLLNSLLGFTDKKEITKVSLNPNELPVTFISSEKGESGVSGSVDVICTTSGGQKIAIEVQRKKTKYLLAREQEYMAKLIAGQVKEKESNKYHEKVLETYILVIAIKENIFSGTTKLSNDKLFELTVQPTVVETGEVVPSNKMNWKFFELPKFKKSDSYKKIDKESPLKEQWLEFLVDCSKQTKEPERNDIIKKGYEIMKTAKWDPTTKSLYWKQKMTEQDFIETMEETKKEEFDKGKLKGEIKGEIKLVKTLTKINHPLESIKQELKFLTDPKVQDKLEANLQYITENAENTSLSDSQILNNLDLAGLLAIEEQNLETIN